MKKIVFRIYNSVIIPSSGYLGFSIFFFTVIKSLSKIQIIALEQSTSGLV